MSSMPFIADPCILEISILENHEEMVDLKDQTDILFGPSPEIPDNQDYTKLRKTLYHKLIQAQDLLPKNLRFCIYEGYRSLDLQKMLFETRFQEIAELYPSWTHQQQFIETTRLVSPIMNLDGSTNIPPHSTGGAVDLYLVDQKGNPVEMGILTKDWMLDVDGSLSKTDSLCISDAAQKYRKIMSEALSNVGLVNYHTEYWHWSYGDRYWAWGAGKSQAIYGSFVEHDKQQKIKP